jgi:hypothetical protein
MNQASFSDILDQETSATERPKPLPVGTYTCTVQGLPRYDKSSKKQTPFVEFTLVPNGTLDDVDQDALEAMGGFHGKTIRATFYLTEDAKWRLMDFLANCGIEDGKYRDCIDQTPGCSIGAVIRHRPAEDGTSVFAELAKTVAL